jgi:long-subunit fatty acid transport protein
MKFLLLALIFCPAAAWCAFSNENSLLIGDRNAGMGGAAVAVEGDAAGAPFYNPGILAFLDGSAFSAAVGIYKKFDVMYGQEEDFTQAPLRVNQGFFRSLPASTGNVIRTPKLPGWTMAFTVVVPDYEQFKGDLRSDATNVSTLTYTDESLWVGGSISRMISDDEGVGLTLYYTARSFARSVSDRSKPDANRTEIYSQERTQTENGILPIVGYYRRINERWSWGMAARLPVMKIQGRATVFESLTTADSTGPTLNATSGGFPEKGARVVIPGKLTAGVGFRPAPSWLFSSDLSLREGISYDDLEDAQYSMAIEHRPVWNISFGVEKEALDWLVIRMGAYTNFSSHPDPDPDVNRAQPDHVDMLGFSTNFVFIAGQKISYTFGGYYTGGRGRSIQRIDQTEKVVPKTMHIFTMLVGTSFSF